MERIEADLLIPGTGEPIRDGVVVWDGPTITYAGPAADAPPTPQAPSTRAATVLPGLWDCHGHLIGARTLDLPTWRWSHWRCGRPAAPLTCGRRWTPG